MQQANLTPVSTIMTTRIVTIDLDDRMSVAKEIYDNVSFHHLLVLDQGKLTGILSHRDYLAAVSPRIGTLAEFTRDTETLNTRIHQVMTHRPITVSGSTSIYDAARVILENDIGCLPILKEGELVGIITWKDLLSFYQQQLITENV
ncbi:CBS domain-containing protein [Shewanella maritima]|uniref:CBS domain-containing protein n=1 Tax=Shewanella maritima TaxID=2520507 RepID=UPI003734D85A